MTLVQSRFLVLLMAIGSVVMWVINPLAWLWVASHVVATQAPTLGGYLLVLVGVLVTFVLMARVLVGLDHRYMDVIGDDREHRFRAPWLESMRGDSASHNSDRGILGTVMVVSVGFALLALTVWFLIAAGNPLPQA